MKPAEAYTPEDYKTTSLLGGGFIIVGHSANITVNFLYEPE